MATKNAPEARSHQMDRIVLGPGGGGHNGTFCRMEPEHPHWYISEFAGRLSDGTACAVERMGGIAQNMVGKKTHLQAVDSKSLCGSP